MSDSPRPDTSFPARIAARAGRLNIGVLAAVYTVAYLVVEIFVDNPIRLYNFCVFLSLSGIYFSWLVGGRKAMTYVAFFNFFFVAVFSKMLWAHGIVIYGGQLFTARSFLVIYALSAGLCLLMLLKKSPADVRTRHQAASLEEARRRQQNLEFMVASRKLTQDLVAQANSVKDELLLLEGAWRSNIHDILNDLSAIKEREVYHQIIEPFQENIIGHLRGLESHLTFDLRTWTLAQLHDFLEETGDQLRRVLGPIVLEIHVQDWQGDPAPVILDRNKFRDMIVNVVRNAQAALDLQRIERLRAQDRQPFTPRIRLVCDRTTKGARIRIIDNGGGVPDELLRRLYREPVPSRKRGNSRPGQGTLFVKFFGERMNMRVQAARTEAAGGAGLEVTLLAPLQEADQNRSEERR